MLLKVRLELVLALSYEIAETLPDNGRLLPRILFLLQFIALLVPHLGLFGLLVLLLRRLELAFALLGILLDPGVVVHAFPAVDCEIAPILVELGHLLEHLAIPSLDRRVEAGTLPRLQLQ